ncbi:MAG: DMT family transporter [Planctomycetota bacterium]
MTAPHSRNRALGFLLALVTSVLWGTVPLAGKVALPGITAATLSVLRLLLAGLCLALFLGCRGSTGLRRLLARPPSLVYLAALGLACNYVCYMLGLERAGAATTQVLIQLAPLFLILLSVVWLGERPRPRQMVGAALALTGLFVVSSASHGAGAHGGQLNTGMALVVFSALTWGVYAAAHKRLGEEHTSGATMMWIFLLASLAIAPTIPLEAARRPDGVQALAIAFLCLNTVVAYWSFAESLRHIEAWIVAVITTLGPVVTLGLVAISNRLGWERIGYEQLGPGKLAGAALVLGGVVLAVATRTVKDANTA